MRKRLLLIIGLMLALFAVTGCGKKEIKADTKLIESKAQMMMSLVEGTEVEALEQFLESPQITRESQLASLMSADAQGNTVSLTDTKIEDFEAILEAWIAANKELGAFVSADGEMAVEQKGAVTEATVKAKFKDRDADVILAFDSETSRLENMTVNGDYARSEVLKKAGLNTLLGMGTVFVVLIIIALVISLFGFLPGVKENKERAKAASEAPAAAPKAAPAAPAAAASNDAEIQAVIAAAIAAYAEETGQDSSGYFVRKIVRRRRS